MKQMVTTLVTASVWVLSTGVAARAEGGWTTVSSPNQEGKRNELRAVTCPGTKSCFTVGDYETTAGVVQTLTERYKLGTWRIISSANETTTSENVLRGVACTSTKNCWAVGYYEVPNSSEQQEPLIEHWNGKAWKLGASASSASGSTKNRLFGVTCVSETDCWAVGSQAPGNAEQTLIEHYDGTSWGPVVSPNAIGSTEALEGIECTGETDCWAVGRYGTVCPELAVEGQRACLLTLTEHYDSSKTWSLVGSPNPRLDEDNLLYAVSCVVSTYCVAVGDSGSNTLVGQYAGGGWSMVPSPSPGTGDDLRAVSCTKAGMCVAAGDYSMGGSAYTTLIEESTGFGRPWTIAESANEATQENFLRGVTCIHACFAVGAAGVVGHYNTLIEKGPST
jgi:hypothetical protein